MSLGIAFKGPEGIVLAADSRVTLTVQMPQQNMVIPATYDNATKLLRVTGQDHVGAVTYGLGAIGGAQPRTAHSYIPEIEAELAKKQVKRLSVPEFAQVLSDFFMKIWKSEMPSDFKGPDMIFLVAGYDENAPYGRVFEIQVPKKPSPNEHHPGKAFGMVWGGQREYADRIIAGYDPRVLEITKKVLNISDEQVVTLRDQFQREIQAPIPFAFLPLQDCVDLSIFIIRATILIQNWLVGVRGVGGAIDVATIIRKEGFKELQKKALVGERS